MPLFHKPILGAGTSKRGIENPDTGWFYPRATMKKKRVARASLISEKITGGAYSVAKNHIMGSGSSELGLVEGRRNRLYFARRFASR